MQSDRHIGGVGGAWLSPDTPAHQAAGRMMVSGGDLSEEEAAALLAALSCLLEEERSGGLPVQASIPSRWRDSSRATIAGLAPTRLATKAAWGTIERLRRGGRGGTGIVGQ
jgi:hypothetical protein